MFSRIKNPATTEGPSGLEIEQAIDEIIRKQGLRNFDDHRYKDQLEEFNLVDNEETQKLLKTLDKLQMKNYVAGTKVNKLKSLNERGFKQI